MSNPATELRAELLTKDSAEDLLKLFRDGYGDYYRHTDVQSAIEYATKIIGLRSQATGALAAGAIILKRRIVAGATSTDRKFGPRMQTGAQLMQECYNANAAWLTIGENHRAVRIGACACGMQRIVDKQIITNLLDEAGWLGRYGIEADQEGNPILITSSASSNAGYRQQVWAWEDRLPATPQLEPDSNNQVIAGIGSIAA